MSNGLIVPTGDETNAALAGNLTDAGEVRRPVVPAPVVRDFTEAEARESVGLTARRTAWVTSEVGDPLVFGENERRKIFAILGDLSPLDLIWNRTLLAVWRAPGAKDLGEGKRLFRSDTSRDEDQWQGSVALVVRMGPTAWVQDYDKDGAPIFWPQMPKVGDWVVFARGYGTRYKINDYQCILLEKETEAIKMLIPFPHAIDIT